MKRRKQAKSMVMQRCFRTQVVKDKKRYDRKAKHKKAPDFGGFSFARCLMFSGSMLKL